jgi:O-antigen/teichoic acid export membrane protein
MQKIINKLNSHKGFKKYLENTSWLFTEKFLKIGIELFVGIWIAKYLGPERFGILSYAQSFVGIFSAIATLGLNSIIVRELVKFPYKENEIISTAFTLKFFGALITIFLINITINFVHNDKSTNTLIIIISSAVIFQSFNVIDMYFQAKVMSKYIVYANIFSLLLSTIIKILLIINNAPLISFAWIILFDSIILAIGYMYWFINIKKINIIEFFKLNLNTAKNLLKDSWPLILSSIVVSIYMRIDQVMIKEMLNNQSVGNYAAAVKLSEAWYFIPIIICSSLFPAIINAKKTNTKLYYKRLQKLYDLMVCMAVIIAIPISFLSKLIIDLLYGNQYNLAGNVLTIHIWASIFVFLGIATGKWFITENLQIFTFYRTLGGVITNITLNFILIPKYGIIGAAIATLISQIMASYLFNIFNQKLRKTFYMQTIAFFYFFRLLKNVINKKYI